MRCDQCLGHDAGRSLHCGEQVRHGGLQPARISRIEQAGRRRRSNFHCAGASFHRCLVLARSPDTEIQYREELGLSMDQSIIDGMPGRYWHRLEDGRIQCDVCPRYCKLHEGQRGLCFVRARQNDQILLTTYGRSSGFCIDPIEKKPLNHFLPGTPVLSFGTAGCNLTCKFCQNWDISKARALDGVQDQASPDAIAQAAVRSGCRSVAFTYNDPVIFLEYAVDVAQACRARRIKTVAVSAGYIAPEPRTEFFRHMDAANIDLKGFTDGFYKTLCSGKLGPVLETLEYLKHETDVWFEITTLVIPGENDSSLEIEAESRWVMER